MKVRDSILLLLSFTAILFVSTKLPSLSLRSVSFEPQSLEFSSASQNCDKPLRLYPQNRHWFIDCAGNSLRLGRQEQAQLFRSLSQLLTRAEPVERVSAATRQLFLTTPEKLSLREAGEIRRLDLLAFNELAGGYYFQEAGQLFFAAVPGLKEELRRLGALEGSFLNFESKPLSVLLEFDESELVISEKLLQSSSLLDWFQKEFRFLKIAQSLPEASWRKASGGVLSTVVLSAPMSNGAITAGTFFLAASEVYYRASGSQLVFQVQASDIFENFLRGETLPFSRQFELAPKREVLTVGGISLKKRAAVDEKLERIMEEQFFSDLRSLKVWTFEACPENFEGRFSIPLSSGDLLTFTSDWRIAARASNCYFVPPRSSRRLETGAASIYELKS